MFSPAIELEEWRGIVPTIGNTGLNRLEAWVVKNSSWLAAGIIAVAFALRFANADSCYLNPDEALHFDVARPSRWLWAFQASRTVTHPPLFVLVLHGILFFGRSELTLRLPSLIGGTAALWFAFAWLRRSLGELPALAGLGFMALSPAAISASTEVRQYGLFILFVCGSLYATERALAERSTAWAIVQGFLLVGALLTHYIAVVVIFSLGLYVLLRWLLDGAPRGVLLVMGAFCFVLAALLVWLYFERVRGWIPFGPGGSMDYLQPYYYSPASETPLGFAWRALHGTFHYAVGTRRLTFLLMLVFLAGLAALLSGRTKARSLMALLVISPFIVGFAAAVAHVFPFAGTRHQSYLLPFLAAGIAAALAWLPRGWAVAPLLLGAAIAPVWVSHSTPDNDVRRMPRGDMTAAIEYAGRMVPPDAPIFADGQTINLLKYYLARDDADLDAWPGIRWRVREQLGKYRIVMVTSGKEGVISFRPDTILEQVRESARGQDVVPADPLWVFTVSWHGPPLASRLPAGEDHGGQQFGYISVLRVYGQ